MKLLKKGFTLAELLLIIGIIGIVSAMGAAMTKKTTEKAYNLYYYTGYINLYNAFTDTRLKDQETEPNEHGAGSCTISMGSPICHINNLLGTQPFNNAVPFTITAKNGITYQFNANSPAATITMGIPQPKTRSNPNGRVLVALKFNSNDYGREGNEFLVPVNPQYINNPAGYVHIGNRRDLLPAYLDNGMVGRKITELNGSGSNYEPIIYYSFDQAACSYIHNSFLNEEKLKSLDNIDILDCNNVSDVPAYNNGVLRFADPRKARG